MKKTEPPVSFRRYAGVLLLMVLMGGAGAWPCAAQDAEEESAHDLPEDTWALQFQINSDVGLNPFQGSTISAKHQLSERKAYRLGFDLFARYDSRGQESDEFESTTSQQELGMDFQFVQYPMPDREIKLYYGAGPTASFLRQKNTSDPGDSERSESTSTSTVWRVGASGLLGAEWFVHRSISLMAEYRSDLRFERQTDKNEREGNEDEARKSAVNGVSLQARGVRFGVSVYF